MEASFSPQQLRQLADLVSEVVRTEVREASAADSLRKPSKAVQVPSQRSVETEVKQTPKSVVPDLRMKTRSKKAEVPSHGLADAEVNPVLEPKTPDHRGKNFWKSAKPHSLDAKENMPDLKVKKRAKVPQSSPQALTDASENQVLESTVPDPKAKKNSKAARVSSHCSADLEESQKSESIVPGLEVEIPSFDENKLIGPYNWPPHDVLDLDSAVGKRYPALYDILTRYEFSLKIAKQETREKLGEKGAWKGLNSADRQAAVLRAWTRTIKNPDFPYDRLSKSRSLTEKYWRAAPISTTRLCGAFHCVRAWLVEHYYDEKSMSPLKHPGEVDSEVEGEEETSEKGTRKGLKKATKTSAPVEKHEEDRTEPEVDADSADVDIDLEGGGG